MDLQPNMMWAHKTPSGEIIPRYGWDYRRLEAVARTHKAIFGETYEIIQIPIPIDSDINDDADDT